MNYFEFFNLKPAFQIDEGELKRRFYENSRKYHPDFYTLASEAEQAANLELSTLNNQAYQTLADPDRRMKYLLEYKGALAAEGNNDIPPDFLMEMMELNEALMELEMAPDAEALETLQHQLKAQEDTLYAEVAAILAAYDDDTATTQELAAIKDYYLKKRYLLRIRESLAKFNLA